MPDLSEPGTFRDPHERPDNTTIIQAKQLSIPPEPAQATLFLVAISLLLVLLLLPTTRYSVLMRLACGVVILGISAQCFISQTDPQPIYALMADISLSLNAALFLMAQLEFLKTLTLFVRRISSLVIFYIQLLFCGACVPFIVSSFFRLYSNRAVQLNAWRIQFVFAASIIVFDLLMQMFLMYISIFKLGRTSTGFVISFVILISTSITLFVVGVYLRMFMIGNVSDASLPAEWLSVSCWFMTEFCSIVAMLMLRYALDMKMNGTPARVASTTPNDREADANGSTDGDKDWGKFDDWHEQRIFGIDGSLLSMQVVVVRERPIHTMQQDSSETALTHTAEAIRSDTPLFMAQLDSVEQARGTTELSVDLSLAKPERAVRHKCDRKYRDKHDRGLRRFSNHRLSFEPKNEHNHNARGMDSSEDAADRSLERPVFELSSDIHSFEARPNILNSFD
eukprot:jgi/Hompol1/764/HPOL_005414-RA